MKTILVSMLYRIARQYFDRDLFDRIEVSVELLLDSAISGDKKRQQVRDAVQAEWNDIQNIVIDTIIQVVLINKVRP